MAFSTPTRPPTVSTPTAPIRRRQEEDVIDPSDPVGTPAQVRRTINFHSPSAVEVVPPSRLSLLLRSGGGVAGGGDDELEAALAASLPVSRRVFSARGRRNLAFLFDEVASDEEE